ncbi:phosphoethanolamine transferase [Vibrio natriegens]|uniref:Phosphoethanolamine transferase n=1 Tax=Vibrio natriegens NBRC 15636 = ATCC 14048 = DSM 759 TaxID=1219067 RepID=A0AAN1CYR8_VIBNA|nr:phosphoethanolamine--lipid A transferase [Vibrio natriegens]ALR17828.1 hydrolase [Vibrio natriegens NBRC 15636 = ATCC 14048 = DSM 759]ANQ15320.1 phosphoethanolamine transferase [Vibrio natriegens NBRC 15636 = ATCC 14048 = DSM 759]EPM41024.1 hydrolase [Vibrio natriegens NBRC 15636 = ATCC 14048 = DSM 759]MDX6029328.1 phosphoethanolamine--lipid A transferase [Vibrio natriegens NBRC 15636 = ATCC 14048 = DSM 759]UUI13970.1 phosphoethanolamine--lipid A transferase [Vibrio natriegens]
MKTVDLQREGISYVTFSFLLAFYFALVVNIPIYKELIGILSSLDNVKVGFVVTIPIFFIAALNFLFNLFSWPWIGKPFFILLLILSSMVSYASYNYGTLFDYGMIANIVETDTSEASSYFSAYSALWVLLMGIVPALVVANTKLRPLSGQCLHFSITKLVSMIASLAVIAGIAALYYQDYASVGRNNSYLKKMIIPTQFVYSAAGYVKKTYLTEPEPYREIGTEAKQSAAALTQAQKKPTLLVFVVGETARSQNYQLNGYERKTNPYTSKLDVISFQDFASCGTATAVSLPCMFSQLTHHNFDRSKADNQDNVLDIMQRAGIDVMWKENDGGDKHVAHKVKKIAVDRAKTDQWCNGTTCYDMALLDNFEQEIDSMEGNRVVTLHLIGSHGPTYFQRYPKDKAFFQPDCPRADIENCSVEQIVNSYDNTIRYTDYVLEQTIDKLTTLEDKYNTALVYISDHGESLGESGMFLHGMPYSLAPDTQKRVPFMMWMSPNFKQAKQINTDCLSQAAQSVGKYSQDNVFHSLLGIMDVKTSAYDGALDIFKTCRTPNA